VSDSLSATVHCLLLDRLHTDGCQSTCSRASGEAFCWLAWASNFNSALAGVEEHHQYVRPQSESAWGWMNQGPTAGQHFLPYIRIDQVFSRGSVAQEVLHEQAFVERLNGYVSSGGARHRLLDAAASSALWAALCLSRLSPKGMAAFVEEVGDQRSGEL